MTQWNFKICNSENEALEFLNGKASGSVHVTYYNKPIVFHTENPFPAPQNPPLQQTPTNWTKLTPTNADDVKTLLGQYPRSREAILQQGDFGWRLWIPI